MENLAANLIIPCRQLYYQGLDMKYDILGVKDRSQDLKLVMEKLDKCMNEFFFSRKKYEITFFESSIAENISPFKKLSNG